SRPSREAPETCLVEDRDPVALLAQALDLHQLPPGVAAGGLERVRTSPDHDRGARRGPAVHRGPGTPRGPHGLAAALAEDAGEREVHALEGLQHACLQGRRRVLESLDELVGALVALAALADAAVDDLLQVVAARQAADLRRPQARPGVA